jgi:hypothetical protein
MKLNHWQYLAATRQLNAPVKCSAYHLTLGGKCLNCGYNPELDYPIKFVVE